MGAWIAAHRALAAVLAFWMASNFVGAMPTPNDKSGMVYRFFFAFLHGLVGSLPRVAATFLPPQYAKFLGAWNGAAT